MRIAVGSKNPVKVEAVRAIIGQIWPMALVESLAVPSDVSDMPMNDEECIRGALGRAARARMAIDADFGVGLEGGIHPAGDCVFLIGWVAVIDRHGTENIGSATRFPLPAQIGRAVRAGRELGPLMDEVTGRQDTNEAEGAIGILTKGLMTRQQSFEMALAYALAPWLNPELYP